MFYGVLEILRRYKGGGVERRNEGLGEDINFSESSFVFVFILRFFYKILFGDFLKELIY